MRMGCLIAVVGPSGVGKDSLLRGVVAARPDLRLVRRSITRPPGLTGEIYDALEPDVFEAAVKAQSFCLHWDAHGLRYGIPVGVLADVRAGVVCVANVSRAVLVQASVVFPALLVLQITARPETLAARLAARGRERPDDIARRLARTATAVSDGVNVVDIRNDGALENAVAQALDVIDTHVADLRKYP